MTFETKRAEAAAAMDGTVRAVLADQAQKLERQDYVCFRCQKYQHGTNSLSPIIDLFLRGRFSRPSWRKALTTDELYLLRQEVAAVLRRKLLAKKNALEERLKQLHPPDDHEITSFLSIGKSKTPGFG